jgi:hypothetical protein
MSLRRKIHGHRERRPEDDGWPGSNIERGEEEGELIILDHVIGDDMAMAFPLQIIMRGFKRHIERAVFFVADNCIYSDLYLIDI